MGTRVSELFDYVFVLGAYGSGTTAVTGVLDELGVFTFPPHFHTNDPRTPCAYEPVQLKKILLRHLSEQDMEVTGDVDQLMQEIGRWLLYVVENEKPAASVAALKHSLLTVILPEILPRLRPKVIVVNRPYEDIERTRVRRNWPAYLGAQGAKKIYENINSGLVRYNKENILDISFPELLSSPVKYIKLLNDFCGLGNDNARINNALSFIRT